MQTPVANVVCEDACGGDERALSGGLRGFHFNFKSELNMPAAGSYNAHFSSM